jgi:hypothetical protein
MFLVEVTSDPVPKPTLTGTVDPTSEGGGRVAIEEGEIRKQARERVQKRRDLGAHIVVYVVVNSMLIGIWAITSGGYFWPAWVLLGWGVGLVLNIWDVYFRRPVTEADVEREMKRNAT